MGNASTKVLLKRVGPEGFNRKLCCFQKCENTSEIIDATHRFSTLDLPLCDKHWVRVCELNGNNNGNEASTNESSRVRRKVDC